MKIMTPEHEKWEEFCELLGGPEGCDFDDEGWLCNASKKRPFARKILEQYFKDVDVRASFDFFDSNGGFCDCEILFNVERSYAAKQTPLPI